MMSAIIIVDLRPA